MSESFDRRPEQRVALTTAGAEKVFAEQVSGAVPDRKALAEAIEALGQETRGTHGHLAGLATFERHLIKARPPEGRTRAKARGAKLGRKLKLSRFQIEEAWRGRRRGNLARILPEATEYHTILYLGWGVNHDQN